MANRTKWKAFRCTTKEVDEITAQAEKNNLTDSDYIRRKVFWLPPETEKTLQDLKYHLLKIGTNINQVVRSCNSKKFITTMDYQELLKYLKSIDEKFSEVSRLLKEENQKQFSDSVDEHIFKTEFFENDNNQFEGELDEK